jgi:hypothetical protein
MKTDGSVSYKVWVPFTDNGKTVCMPLKQLAFPLPSSLTSR